MLILFCFVFFFDSKKPGAFDKHDFELLAPVLDGFSLMTYDYSSQGRYDTYKSSELFILSSMQYYTLLNGLAGNTLPYLAFLLNLSNRGQ